MERRWGSPDAATAAIRHAVRLTLADLADGPPQPPGLVLVACSGPAPARAGAAVAADTSAMSLRKVRRSTGLVGVVRGGWSPAIVVLRGEAFPSGNPRCHDLRSGKTP